MTDELRQQLNGIEQHEKEKRDPHQNGAQKIKELRPGDSTSYQVKGQTLLLDPLPIGKLKRVFAVLSEPNKDDFAQTIADYLLLVFDTDQNPFLTREWIEKNISLPIYNQIVVDATRINGLSGFLDRTQETRELVETNFNGQTVMIPPTHSPSPTSITSSPSTTNGQ